MVDVHEARVAHRRVLDAGEGTTDAQWREEKQRCAWRAHKAMAGPARRRWKMATAACHLRTHHRAQDGPEGFLETYASTMNHLEDVQTVQALAEAAEEDPSVEARIAARSETPTALTVMGRADARVETRWHAAQALIAWTRAGLMPVDADSPAEVVQLMQHPVVQRSIHTLAMRLADPDTVAPGRGREAQEGTAMEVVENLLERGPEGIEEQLLENLDMFMEAAEKGGSFCAARIAARIAFEGKDGGRHDRNRRMVLARMAALPAGDGEMEPPAVEALEAWTQIAEDMASEPEGQSNGTSAGTSLTQGTPDQERLAWAADAKSFLQGLIPRLVLPLNGSSASREPIRRLRSHARDALLATCRVLGYSLFLEAVSQCFGAANARMQTRTTETPWTSWQRAETQLFACASALDAWHDNEQGQCDATIGYRPAILVEQMLPFLKGDQSLDGVALSLAMESAARCIEREALWILENRGSPLTPWLAVGLEAWGAPSPSAALAGACALQEICSAAVSRAEAGMLDLTNVEVLTQAAASMASAPLLPDIDAEADVHLASVLVSVVDAVRTCSDRQRACEIASRLVGQALECLLETMSLRQSHVGASGSRKDHNRESFAARACLRAFHLASACEWEPSWTYEDCSNSVSGMCGDAVSKMWPEMSRALLGASRQQPFLSIESAELAWAKAVSAAMGAAPKSWANLASDVAQAAAGVFERSPESASALLGALASMGHQQVLQVLSESPTVAVLHMPGQADRTPDAAIAFLSLTTDCLLQQPWADIPSWEQSLALTYKVALAAASAYHQGAARAALQFLTTILDRATRLDAAAFLVPAVLAHGKDTVCTTFHVLHGDLAMPRMGKCSACLECLALLAGRYGGAGLADGWCEALPLASGGSVCELAGWIRAAALEEERKQVRVLNSMHSKQLRRICRSLVEEGRRSAR